jgi:hypothetical protein
MQLQLNLLLLNFVAVAESGLDADVLIDAVALIAIANKLPYKAKP